MTPTTWNRTVVRKFVFVYESIAASHINFSVSRTFVIVLTAIFAGSDICHRDCDGRQAAKV